MLSTMNRYHVHLGEKRTTACLDDTLAHLMALKLGMVPKTVEAHSAIREWLQAQLDELGDPGRIRVSQWLQGQAILSVSDKILSKKFRKWILSEI